MKSLHEEFQNEEKVDKSWDPYGDRIIGHYSKAYLAKYEKWLEEKVNQLRKENGTLEFENKGKIELLIKCWRKHCADDNSVGWEELSEELSDTLPNILGNEEYIKLQNKYYKI